jgi:hypothetical protein
VVFSIIAFGSANFYDVAWNQECFHRNKIGNFMGEKESNLDLVDYDDWTFVNIILCVN